MQRLIDAGFLDYEPPPTGVPDAALFEPGAGLRLLAVSGEGAVVPDADLVLPILSQVASSAETGEPGPVAVAAQRGPAFDAAPPDGADPAAAACRLRRPDPRRRGAAGAGLDRRRPRVLRRSRRRRAGPRARRRPASTGTTASGRARSRCSRRPSTPAARRDEPSRPEADGDDGVHAIAAARARARRRRRCRPGTSSRALTGFARVLAMGAALGATSLGDTYQAANLVSNVLFELLAGGMLSAVLVPTFVARLAGGDRDGAPSGWRDGSSASAPPSSARSPLVGMVAAPAIMRVLTAAVDNAAVRDRQVELGAFLLLFFLPQLVLYGAGAVATAVLHADRRFGAAAAAPVANNIVVIATMVAFGVAARRRHRPLPLDRGQLLVLALGTTAGVLAMTARAVAVAATVR